MPREITAFSNPLVKQVRGLRDKKNRRRDGLFLAEGLRILTEAREAGFLPEILFFNASEPRHPLLDAADRRDRGRRRRGDRDQRRHPPQDVRQGQSADRARRLSRVPDRSLDRDRPRRSADLWIVAQALRDPGNLGTILRTGDAVGAGGLILIDDCADPFSVEAVRASMGALFTQAIATARWDEFVAWLRAGDGELIGTSLNADAGLSASRATASRPSSWSATSRPGCPPAYEAECDLLVKMPMMGKADSLNAAVATAVMAYEVINQWRRG